MNKNDSDKEGKKKMEFTCCRSNELGPMHRIEEHKQLSSQYLHPGASPPLQILRQKTSHLLT